MSDPIFTPARFATVTLSELDAKDFYIPGRTIVAQVQKLYGFEEGTGIAPQITGILDQTRPSIPKATTKTFWVTGQVFRDTTTPFPRFYIVNVSMASKRKAIFSIRMKLN